MTAQETRSLAANTLRALALDMTNAANSGHPGAPMGLADIATVLFGEVLRFDPKDPTWANRDRFVLSNGHASALLYSLLHLSGHELSLDELRRFRQLGSKTPGHPEYGMTPGVETTTGPLGQGFVNGVGMAIGARMMRARFAGDGSFAPIDHSVFAICGDGCLMEGVTAEAASIAGHLGLGELVYVFDDNQITIDGKTNITFTEDVKARFVAYRWHVLEVDGHDQDAVKAALLVGKAEKTKPTLIIAKTHIGFGSPNRQDTSKAHGEPMGEAETKLTKEKLGWNHPPFHIPADVQAYFAAAGARGHAEHETWTSKLQAWKKADASRAAQWDAHWSREVRADFWASALEKLKAAKGATRAMSGTAINELAKELPGLIGGSADLAGSNKSEIKGSAFLAPGEFAGRNIHFGVREHAMASIANGLVLYGAFVPFGATFLVFSDYMRPALRLAALMKVRQLMVFTHDSIYLGEDGPTHQPVEHLAALRLIPGYTVWRPADGLETAMSWAYAVGEGEEGPHGLVFTRQDVPVLERAAGFDPKTVWRGGYRLVDRPGAKVAIIATGSEVHIAVEAAALLAAKGHLVNVVSIPSVERFRAQDAAYQTSVLGADARLVSLELGRTTSWREFTGLSGLNIGIDRFGESAPYEALAEHFGFTAEKVAAKIELWLKS